LFYASGRVLPSGDGSAVIFRVGGFFYDPDHPIGRPAVNVTRMFSLDKKVWCEGQTLPVPVADHALVNFNNQAVIIGGFHGKEDDSKGSVDVATYDPQKDSYGNIASLKVIRESLAAAVGADGKIYAIGGSGSGAEGGIDSSTEIFDGKSWKQGPELINARQHPVAGSIHDEIWVIGGQNVGNPVAQETEFLNTKDHGPKWQKGPSLQYGRLLGAGVASLGDTLYVCGGYKDDMSGPSDICEKLQRNALVNAPAVWSTVASLSQARYGHELIAYGNKLYAIGGHNRNLVQPVKSIEEYDPDTDKWSVLAEFPDEQDYANPRYVLLTNVPDSSMQCP